jgi:hypothetical protein
MKPGVSQRSTLGSLLFNAFIGDIYSLIHNFKNIVFADNLEIYRITTTVEESSFIVVRLGALIMALN